MTWIFLALAWIFSVFIATIVMRFLFKINDRVYLIKEDEDENIHSN
jgi:hypothetical protein